MDQDQMARVHLVTGDITEADSPSPIIDRFTVTNIIHRGLQVPTCRADPRLGALVNVIGTINVFEAVRRAGGQIKKVVRQLSRRLGASEDDRR